MNKKPQRIKNYMFVREKKGNELDWVRAERIHADNLERPIVLCNGAFDLLHASHARLLFQAREVGKTVIVAMDSDRKIRQFKGAARPIMSWTERATMLQYMPIDLLCEIDSEEEMNDLIYRVKPDLRVQGADHMKTVTRYPFLRKVFVRTGGIHTSDIVNRIIERHTADDIT